MKKELTSSFINNNLIEKNLRNYKFYEEEDPFKKGFLKCLAILQHCVNITNNMYLLSTSKMVSRLKNGGFDFAFLTLTIELEKYIDKENTTQIFTSFQTLELVLMIVDKLCKGILTREDKVNLIAYLIKQDYNIIQKYGTESLKESNVLEKRILDYNTVHCNTSDSNPLYSKIMKNIINLEIPKEQFLYSIEILEKKYIEEQSISIVDDPIENMMLFASLGLSSEISLLFYAILKDKMEREQYKKTKKENNSKIDVKKKAIEVLSSNKVKVNNITALKEKEEIRPIKMRPCYTARLQENVIDSTPIQRNIKPRKKSEIVKELSNYIDIENLTLKKVISMEDKFYILELLTDLNKDRSAISTLITNINLQISNSIGEKTLKQLRYLFANNIEKYYFYWQKKGYTDIEKYLKSLEDNFNALACESNEELEELFIDEIKNALMSLENICPATYEYEFTTLEKQKKKRKGGK